MTKNPRGNMKLPRAYARGIFSHRFVGSEIPPKRKTLRFHPRAYAHGFSRRGIKYKGFELVYRNLASPLTGFIIKKTGGNKEAVDEVFSRTISAAWQGFHTFKHKSSYFTWICRIALNKIADYYRGQVNESSHFIAPFLEDVAFIEDPNIRPDEKLALDELRVSIRNCLNLLPKEKRNLLYLRYWEDLTIKQIAKQTGTSERAIEGKIYRAKNLLKKLFETNYPETSKVFIKK